MLDPSPEGSGSELAAVSSTQCLRGVHPDDDQAPPWDSGATVPTELICEGRIDHG